MSKLNKSEKRTRQRGKNFSPSEEDMLLSLLKPYKPIIDNKKSDALTCQMKKDAWEQLAQEFNDQTGMHRSWRTLKDKYKNMNTKIKTEGKRLVDHSISQLEDFELSASSCVSVVYEEVGEVHEEQEKETNKCIEEPMDVKPENNEENPCQEDVPIEFPKANQSPPSPDISPSNNSERSLEANRIELFRLQQRFYNNENKRHCLELKNLKLKKQILELELEEHQRKRMKFIKESTTS
ncbi:uncharacterized protein LOC110176821 [Drosophila serrata]|uniref:uncharacterized protein LOC110176821 n=1 Tax=Drosophila serrata TaxID=7274 RepID=UPI000A1D10B9|nr:uncharacterized protein LOC110176821 [Drosophila serrata]